MQENMQNTRNIGKKYMKKYFLHIWIFLLCLISTRRHVLQTSIISKAAHFLPHTENWHTWITHNLLFKHSYFTSHWDKSPICDRKLDVWWKLAKSFIWIFALIFTHKIQTFWQVLAKSNRISNISWILLEFMDKKWDT